MGGHTKPRVGGQGRNRLLRTVHNAHVAVDVIAKTHLTGTQRAPIHAALHIHHGQQGQADSGLICRRADALGHCRALVIRRAAGLVVQVMKFGHSRISGLQHFHLHLRCDRLNVLRSQLVQKAKHQLPPCPETVGFIRAAPF